MKARRNWSALALSSAVLALSIAGAPKAQAQSNRYAEDAARVAQIMTWIDGTWSFFTGVRTAVLFLTGFDGGNAPITLGDIRDTVVSALNEVNANDLANDVAGLADIFHEVQVETRGVAMNMMATGQDMNNLMTSPFAREYLASRLADLRNKGTALFNKLEPIMRGNTCENDRLMVAVTPAYTVLVPLVASSMKLIGEIEPSLKASQDQLIAEKLAIAVQTHFMAAGAYALTARSDDPLTEAQISAWQNFSAGAPSFVRRHFSWDFYSPVGDDIGWLQKLPLHRYYQQNSCGVQSRFALPNLLFHQYQEIPLVKLALGSLQNIVDAGYSTVKATNVYVYDPNTYDPYTIPPICCNPKRIPSAIGRITQVRKQAW